MLRNAFLSSVMVLCLTVVASAAPTIVVPSFDVPQNVLHEFFIEVSGEAGDVFMGVNLHLDMRPNGANPGPLITEFDFLSPGLLFASNNTGQTGYGDPIVEVPGHTPAYSVTTNTGTVGPNGNLARIVIDTTGIAEGAYVLALTNPFVDESSLPPLTGLVLTSGVINVVPEPSSIVMGAFAAAGLGAMVIRRRRARKA